jgi:hypothetical protein
VKQDAREKVDQDREKEENDITGCDEVVVPLVKVGVFGMKWGR